MKDRAMQALYLMALEPVSETMADKNSYGFRKKRGTQDAIQALHILLCKWYSPQWILEADIKGCFDHISHEWLTEHVPTDKQVLRKWLNCGVVFNKILSPTKDGTPQGGIISPTLANMTLDGLERKPIKNGIRARVTDIVRKYIWFGMLMILSSPPIPKKNWKHSNRR